MSDNVAHAVAGAGGGIASMILTYPLITLSTRSQVEAKRAETSVADAVRRIIAREGVSGLYSGLESALFGISVTNFVYYYWYEWSKGVLENRSVRRGLGKKLSTLESMAAGALAGSATVLITNPIWVVNTRMTARQNSKNATESDSPTLAEPNPKPKSPSTLAVLQQLLKNEGFQALFAGVIPALVLVINPILQYTIFEQLKNILERRKGTRLAPTDAFYLGAIGKLFATGITYPYITVKSRMHVADKSDKQTMFQSLNKIVQEEGWAGLYKGVGPKLLQSVITAAFLFAFKDAFYAMTIKARSRAKTLKA